MSDEYDLKPREPEREVNRSDPTRPDFVPPVPIVEGPDRDLPEPPDPELVDAQEHKVTAIVGYFVFLVPLLFASDSRFARYHANQALLVFLTGMAWLVCVAGVQVLWIVLELVFPLSGLISYALHVLAGLGLFAFFGAVVALLVQGILNAASLEKKPLPVIGKVVLIQEVMPSSEDGSSK